MDFIAIAKRWISTVLAVALGVTADVIAALLPSQPRWLAQVRALALQLHAAEQHGAAASRPAEGPPPDMTLTPAEHGGDLGALLESHTVLQQSLLDFEARGLGLDPVLLERMAKDWTPASIVSYLQSCEQQLRQRSTEALAVASAPFGGLPAAGPTVDARDSTSGSSRGKTTPRAKGSQTGRCRGKQSNASASRAD